MHTLIKAYQFKLYQSRKLKHLETCIYLAAEIWNWCIALHRRYYKSTRKYPSANRVKMLITKLKRMERFAHWNMLNSQAIQDIVERIDRSYQAFFLHLKHKRKGKKSPPHYKKRSRYSSFTLKQCGYKIHDGENKITIMGYTFRYHKSREVTGKICTVTVKRTGLGEYFVFIVMRQELPEIPARAGKAAGMDFGLKHFLTLDDGRIIESPQWYKAALSELRAAHRKLSRCQKGSNHWERARRNLGRAYEKVSNCRRDWFFKLAHQLTDEFAVICIEDLNLDGMKRLWGRKVSDLGFAEFVSILQYIASTKGVHVVKVSRWEATTKTCRFCGYRIPHLGLDEREWECPHCSAHLDRDVNAAINIKETGLAKLAATA